MFKHPEIFSLKGEINISVLLPPDNLHVSTARFSLFFLTLLLILQYILKALMRQNMTLIPCFVSLNTFNIYCKISGKLRDKVPDSDTALL